MVQRNLMQQVKATGNGLKTKPPFALIIRAADSEDEGKDINGRNRGYLQTAILDDGNTDLDNSLVAEAYVRLVLNEMFANTANFQYVADKFSGAKNPDGWVDSIRITEAF
jgi:hypothetical protein